MNLQLDKVEKIRSSNNKLWMDIMRLAMKKSPKETKRIIRMICQNDALVTALLRDIS